MDLFATGVALAGAALPAARPLDGIDLTPLLFDARPLPPRPFIHYRGDQLFACRLGEWKAHFRTQEAYGQRTCPAYS